VAAAPDTPYLEIVSHRYPAATLFDSVGAIYQAVAAQRGFFVLTSRGLFHSENVCNSTPDMTPRSLKLDAVGLPSAVRETLAASAGSSRLVLTGHAESLALVTPSATFVLNCTSDACVTHASVVADVGQVTSATADPSTNSVWVCSLRGLFRWQPQQGLQQLLNRTTAATVIALSILRSRVAVATQRRLYQYDLKTTHLLRWDWITDVVAGQGGVIDDHPTALSYAPDGTLWIGTASCLNALYNDGTVSRFAGKNGLPMSNHTTIDASTWVLPQPMTTELKIVSSTDAEHPVRSL
jgi:ligand-binding sensor domain-containing protein